MRIREAKPSDAGAIASIYMESRKAAWRGLIDDEYLDGLDVVHEESEALAILSDPPHGWGTTVAEEAEVAGYLRAGPGEDAPGSVHIGALFVAPQFFGHGIGSALLAEAETRFLGQGFVDGYLFALVDDPRVVNFYTKRGFLPDGGRSTIELDRTRDVIRLRKTLSTREP